MKYLLFTQEGVNIKGLYPFTLTRNPQDMMMGMMTNRQRWERTLHLPSIDLEESGKLPSLHPQIKWQDIKAWIPCIYCKVTCYHQKPDF
ncbi:MAG: hypothetical protein IPH58_12985 [Sphingobacteriales bacterium]|nr:hypothetical protein [Sphingobacteriales bacterium]